MSDQQLLSLIQFQRKFASKEDCHSHLFTMKWPKGFHCAKCGHDQCYETKTRVDLTKWFLALYLVARYFCSHGVSET